MAVYKNQPLPRLPLDGSLDLTYRCNNRCQHCWLWTSPNAIENQELSFDEICRIVSEARQMGCQAWKISGGEPMLRPDFPEIFDFITRKSVTYSINTNGTLITPEIAQLLTRNGRKMIALYGATEEVHDRITHNPGSFQSALQGMRYLKEAGANFVVQLIPMQSNLHQYQAMVDLAQTLSPYYRLGATWLWMSGCQSEHDNWRITNERLDPVDVIALEKPIAEEERDIGFEGDYQAQDHPKPQDDRLFATCISSRRSFHIDPYGQMSFCSFIKDPMLRYDLRQGSFQDAWDIFIPSIVDMVHSNQEYHDNCGSCDLRHHCDWCAVYGYLEHGRYTARVEYLCEIAQERRRYKEEWKLNHIRYYQLAGTTIRISTDFPLEEDTFLPKFEDFRVSENGADQIELRLFSTIPNMAELTLGKEIFSESPWKIYQQQTGRAYLMGSDLDNGKEPIAMVITDERYRSISIFREKDFKWKNLHALTTFPSDQVIFANSLADFNACYFHSAGIIVNGQGLLFVGHSGLGKSTMMKMFREKGEILCDDRNVVRRWPEEFRVHGTWSHGELPDVSPASAPLRAIFFLEQAKTNEFTEITDKAERLGKILTHAVKAFITKDWWEKTLNLAECISSEVPIYQLRFDKSGQVVDLLKPFYDENRIEG